MTAPTPPTRADVERKFSDLVAGRTTRKAVDRWAGQRVGAFETDVEDPVVWWALTMLYGVDLQAGPDQYLHDDEQLAEWLQEFRDRARGEPATMERRAPFRAILALTDEVPYLIARERLRKLSEGTGPAARRRPDSKPPKSTCHLQPAPGAAALCGHPGDQLIEILGPAAFTDVPEQLRCPKCSWRMRGGADPGVGQPASAEPGSTAPAETAADA
jgi:hypothetical protein